MARGTPPGGWSTQTGVPFARGGLARYKAGEEPTYSNVDLREVRTTIRRGEARTHKIGGWRLMNARYTGRCEQCGRPIDILDPIAHKPGHLRHRECLNNQRTRTYRTG